MATYAELRSAEENDVLRIKVREACLVAATTIMAEATSVPNNAQRIKWAKQVFESPESAAAAMLPVVIAQSRASTFAQITTASDAAVQTAVDSAVNVFAQGL
jgi:hypothetical protein